MRRRELEVALRAAGRIAREDEFFLIGSQAVHAACRRPPAEVLLSLECDVYPKSHPESAGLLDRELGRSSTFAARHGFYVDVVDPEIATLPGGWRLRLVPLRAGRVTAFCLEVHDLVASKLAAGRLKDFEFVGALLHRGLADPGIVRRRITRIRPADRRPELRLRLRLLLEELADGRTRQRR